MGFYDYRTVSEEQVSYYVFDDLFFQFNQRGDFDIFRYDTLEEAMAKYRDLPTNMTTALGVHYSTNGEVDLMHRREGEDTLSPDYLAYAKARTHSDVLRALSTLSEAFNIQWQSNYWCLPQETILTPLERGFERTPDPVFRDKILRPLPPHAYGVKPSAFTAINEGYVEGEGWVPYLKLRAKAEQKNGDPHRIKVRQFNVNFTDADGREGQADISPLDLQILLERHAIQYGTPEEAKAAKDKLAEEIAELVVTTGPAQDEYKETLKEALSAGKLNSAEEALETMRDYGESDHKIAVACRLLARLHSIAMNEREALPELCYAVLDLTGDLVVVKKGEEGYFRTSYNTDSISKNKELAAYLNERLEVTPAQAKAMEFGSRFGWDSRGARPETYERKRRLDAQISDAEARKSAPAQPEQAKEQTRE